MAIKFYGSGHKYSEFSNFYRRPINIDGDSWPTTEHYFQAMKSKYPAIQQFIRVASSPGEAKHLGSEIRLRDDWENIKYSVMQKAVLAKFSQYLDLQDLLLSTENEEIIENSPIDYIWGCGKDGSGANWLGKILMETRKKLRETA